MTSAAKIRAARHLASLSQADIAAATGPILADRQARGKRASCFGVAGCDRIHPPRSRKGWRRIHQRRPTGSPTAEGEMTITGQQVKADILSRRSMLAITAVVDI